MIDALTGTGEDFNMVDFNIAVAKFKNYFVPKNGINMKFINSNKRNKTLGKPCIGFIHGCRKSQKSVNVEHVKTIRSRLK